MKQEFVTLPREVLDRAMEALLNEGNFRKLRKPLIEESIKQIKAALEQPQECYDQRDPLADQQIDAIAESMPGGLDGFLKGWGWRQFARAVLEAAPQPPALDQPQSEQPAMTPIAQRKLEDLMASGYTISGYSVYHERKHQHGFVTGAGLVGWWKPDGVEYPQPRVEQEPVASLADAIRSEPTELIHKWRVLELIQDHAKQQPKREPLTNEQVKAGLIHSIEYTDARERCAFNIGVRFAERAHGIK